MVVLIKEKIYLLFHLRKKTENDNNAPFRGKSFLFTNDVKLFSMFNLRGAFKTEPHMIEVWINGAFYLAWFFFLKLCS